MEKYSVILLKESKIENPNTNITNSENVKIFEESIVLCHLPENFFDDNSYKHIFKYFSEKIPAHKYTNTYGEHISNEIVAIIDFFYILEDIEFDDFTEVYSRHLTESLSTTLEDMIKKYYFDYTIVNRN